MQRAMLGAMGFILAIAVASGALAVSNEPDRKARPQTICPPCRQNLEKFGRSLHVTHEGKRVYVCCAGCAAKMQNDWKGYLGIMADLGEEPEKLSPKKAPSSSDKPVIANPEGRGLCEACMDGACELRAHKPAKKHSGN
jgi:hypothetical protein